MNILILRGIGCDERVLKTLDLNNQDCVDMDYPSLMDDDTKSIEDLAYKFNNALEKNEFDGVITHSMGGLVALKMFEKGWLAARFFIAIETNFVPAKKPYRTLFHPNTKDSLQNELTDMLKNELPLYPSALKASLKDAFDFEKSLASLNIPTYLIYGQRDTKDEATWINNLNLQGETLNALTLEFIDHSAHFPTLENPGSTNKVIKDIIETHDSQ